MKRATALPGVGTFANLEAILSQITFKDWVIRRGELGDGFYIQWEFLAEDHDNPNWDMKFQRGRKWYISKFATDEEVIKTAWLAVEIAMRHEAMECFKVLGVAPFNPHACVSHLMDAPLVKRQDPETNIGGAQ